MDLILLLPGDRSWQRGRSHPSRLVELSSAHGNGGVNLPLKESSIRGRIESNGGMRQQDVTAPKFCVARPAAWVDCFCSWQRGRCHTGRKNMGVNLPNKR